MANHCEVCTAKPMTIPAIDVVISRINQERLGGKLTVEMGEAGLGDDGESWHVMLGIETRTFWLNNANSFEMKHGGGTQLMWWMDGLITNEVAREFSGTVKDDADSEPQPPREVWPTFLEYAIEDSVRLFDRATLDELLERAAGIYDWFSHWEHTPACVAFTKEQLLDGIRQAATRATESFSPTVPQPEPSGQ